MYGILILVCMQFNSTILELYLHHHPGPVGANKFGIRKPLTSLLVKYFKSSISPKFVPPGNVSTFGSSSFCCLEDNPHWVIGIMHYQ